MRFAPLVLLASVSSAFAYTVLSPNQSQGWTNQGAQSLTWSRVGTDRENFTVVLTNNDRKLMPTDQVLAALVDGSLGNTTLNPPSAGWPSPGTGYRVNLVAEATNLNSILAQSTSFEIKLSTVIPSSSRTSAANTRTASASGSDPTDDTLKPTSAASSFGVPAALVAVFSFLPAILA